MACQEQPWLLRARWQQPKNSQAARSRRMHAGRPGRPGALHRTHANAREAGMPAPPSGGWAAGQLGGRIVPIPASSHARADCASQPLACNRHADGMEGRTTVSGLRFAVSMTSAAIRFRQ